MVKVLKASRTAVLVCQGRAAADGLIASGRFADPVAMPLLRPDEREAVQWARDGAVPRQWQQRVDYETVRASAELIVPRTVAIDDAAVNLVPEECLAAWDRDAGAQHVVLRTERESRALPGGLEEALAARYGTSPVRRLG